MKLAYKQIDGFLKNPPKHVRAILIYGPNHGLMQERSKNLGTLYVSDLSDPFNVIKMGGDEIVNDEARLNDEAHAQSLMGGDRLIFITEADDKCAATLKAYIQTPSDTCMILVEAAELGPRSSLRQLFEKEGDMAAVPCYADDERGRATALQSILSEYGHTADFEAVRFLSSALPTDRAQMRTELDKLSLYAGPEKKHITLDIAQAACGDTQSATLDEFLYACFSKDLNRALQHLSTMMAEGTPLITIQRALQTHARKLLLTHAYRQEQNMSVPEAMKKLSPPIFFKFEKAFQNQISQWSPEALQTLLGKLMLVEEQTKSTGLPPETLLLQWTVGAALAR